ncbi:hypothetical protein I3843_11G181400 [Carya illinoinensis]|nr:hypothetical protein I3843_11G181400 [Carya illinoinensis]
MAGVLQFLAASLFLYSLIMITVSQFHFSTSAKLSGLSLKIIPRDCPESPLYPGDHLTRLERMERLIKFSTARAQYLETISMSTVNSTILDNKNIRFTLFRDNFFFMVQVGIGLPEKLVFLLMDTGGGLIWTQCEPCKNCYKQAYPIYNSRASITYRKLPCNHPLCKGDSARYQCVNGECVYDLGYLGGASTKGVASFETFKVPVDESNAKYIYNVIFGCSNDNQGMQFAKNGVISGVLGLSLSPDSLVSQTLDEDYRRFSYCLIPFDEAVVMAPSLLRFGADIPLPPTNIQTTPFVKPPAGTNYYLLNLQDVSVGFHRLGFPPDTFKPKQDGTGGCIIDSGALISRLDQNTINGRNAYMEVMDAFKNHYDYFKLQRIGKVAEGLELCYEYKQDFVEYATMTYHFEGADYNVESKYVNFYDTQAGYFCVALLPGNGKSLLGAWHQQNMRIIYDGKIGALQFATEHCATNNHIN